MQLEFSSSTHDSIKTFLLGLEPNKGKSFSRASQFLGGNVDRLFVKDGNKSYFVQFNRMRKFVPEISVPTKRNRSQSFGSWVGDKQVAKKVEELAWFEILI